MRPYMTHTPCLPSTCELGCLFEMKYRLSAKVMSAVGQGGGCGSTLLYSLRSLPERLQAVAPGCCHFALATWIHRQSDPWLTLQRTLSTHSIQQYTLLLPRLALVLWTCQIWNCVGGSESACSSLKKTNNASEWCFSSVPFLLCSRPVFSLSYIPTATTLSSVYLSCVSKYATKVNSTDSAWE